MFLTTDIGIVLLSDLRFELFKATVVISPSPCNPITIRKQIQILPYKGGIHVGIHL